MFSPMIFVAICCIVFLNHIVISVVFFQVSCIKVMVPTYTLRSNLVRWSQCWAAVNKGAWTAEAVMGILRPVALWHQWPWPVGGMAVSMWETLITSVNLVPIAERWPVSCNSGMQGQEHLGVRVMSSCVIVSPAV